MKMVDSTPPGRLPRRPTACAQVGLRQAGLAAQRVGLGDPPPAATPARVIAVTMVEKKPKSMPEMVSLVRTAAMLCGVRPDPVSEASVALPGLAPASCCAGSSPHPRCRQHGCCRSNGRPGSLHWPLGQPAPLRELSTVELPTNDEVGRNGPVKL